MNRRTFLAGTALAVPSASVAALAAAAPASVEAADPVALIFAEWQEIEDRINVLWKEDIEAPDDLYTRQHDIEDAMMKTAPTSFAGLAALARIAWDLNGHGLAEGTEAAQQAEQSPHNKVLLRLIEGADRLAGRARA